MAYPTDEFDDFDYDDTEDCANCGGEGFVSHCFEEWACMHPDEGCDLCMRRCDWCNPAPGKPQNEVDGLRQVLADALADALAKALAKAKP